MRICVVKRLVYDGYTRLIHDRDIYKLHLGPTEIILVIISAFLYR